jgi:hypothetical protein
MSLLLSGKGRSRPTAGTDRCESPRNHTLCDRVRRAAGGAARRPPISPNSARKAAQPIAALNPYNMNVGPSPHAMASLQCTAGTRLNAIEQWQEPCHCYG